MNKASRVISDPAWGDHPLVADSSRTVEIGPVRVDFRFEAGELRLGHGRLADRSASASADPGDWGRWVLPSNSRTISLLPALPERTIVAAPELSFSVAPGAKAKIYLRVPATVTVGLAGGDGPPFLELPTVVLSDTWWGSFADGELCFWLPTTARRTLTQDSFQPHLVICPVLIRNESNELLNVDKLAVRSRHLSIFSDSGRLWADETLVEFQGEEEGSEIETTGRRPDEAPDASLVTPPRSPIERGIKARTFARIKSISGLGG